MPGFRITTYCQRHSGKFRMMQHFYTGIKTVHITMQDHTLTQTFHLPAVSFNMMSYQFLYV